jgi:catechol 2,3-dioxygenase-like lactoylglutathione lyase family enzyme
MNPPIISAVASADLAVTDLAAARDFFETVWRLDVVAQEQDRIYLRATGPQFSVLSLRQAPSPGIVRITLEAHDRSSVELAHARAVAGGHAVDGPPRALTTPGGGYGFGVVDPEGRNYAVVHGLARHADRGPLPGLPSKITHINLNSIDNDTSYRFTMDVLGFVLSDQTRMFRFLRCNSDHHSLGLSFSDNTCLNHIAFEMPDIDSVMLGIGRMRDHGHAIEWGPGRHGPGDNVFAYFCGPDDMPIEYTAEVEQVDDSYHVRKPEEWHWPPGRVDQWGVSPGPSARVKRSQSSIPFIPGGHRLD